MAAASSHSCLTDEAAVTRAHMPPHRPEKNFLATPLTPARLHVASVIYGSACNLSFRKPSLLIRAQDGTQTSISFFFSRHVATALGAASHKRRLHANKVLEAEKFHLLLFFFTNKYQVTRAVEWSSIYVNTTINLNSRVVRHAAVPLRTSERLLHVYYA